VVLEVVEELDAAVEAVEDVFAYEKNVRS